MPPSTRCRGGRTGAASCRDSRGGSSRERPWPEQGRRWSACARSTRPTPEWDRRGRLLPRSAGSTHWWPWPWPWACLRRLLLPRSNLEIGSSAWTREGRPAGLLGPLPRWARSLSLPRARNPVRPLASRGRRIAARVLRHPTPAGAAAPSPARRLRGPGATISARRRSSQPARTPPLQDAPHRDRRLSARGDPCTEAAADPAPRPSSAGNHRRVRGLPDGVSRAATRRDSGR